jgi:hypothetical protein
LASVGAQDGGVINTVAVEKMLQGLGAALITVERSEVTVRKNRIGTKLEAVA